MDLSTLAAGVGTPQARSTETSQADTSSEASQDVASQAEEFDTFLNLLTAQIRNQDPLAPVDSTQFVDQLATFSNLELQAKNNQILESIANMLAAQIGQSEPTPEETPAEAPETPDAA